MSSFLQQNTTTIQNLLDTINELPEAIQALDWNENDPLATGYIANKPSIEKGIGEDSIQEGANTYAFGTGAHAEGNYEIPNQNWRLTTTDPERKVWKYTARGTATVGDYLNYADTLLRIVAVTPSTSTITLSESAPGSSTQNVAFQYYGKIGAYGDYSHAEGSSTNAVGAYSHAEGLGTTTAAEAQHVEGKYNSPDASQAHILGWGTSSKDADRKNIHAISTTGDARFAGDVYVNCTGQTLQEEAKKVATEKYVDDKTYTITANAEGDEVISLTGTQGDNSVSYSVSHAQQGPENGYISSNETTSIGATGGTIKIPQITVDTYGHVTAAADEDVVINWPDLSGYKIKQDKVTSPTASSSTSSTFIDTIKQDENGQITATKKTASVAWSNVTSKPSIKAGSGQGSIVENDPDNSASGKWSHAEGQTTHATGDHCHAEGGETWATHHCAHAEGHGSEARNEAAHAEGFETVASGLNSHSEGHYTKASGDRSHAEGNYTTSSGDGSHAEGHLTTAYGAYSHAEGLGQTTDNLCPLVIKKTGNSYAYHVGMGETTYSVANKSSADDNYNYGFTQDADGYFCSNNINIHNSYALCQVNINAPKDDVIYFHIVSSTESADRTYFSTIDSTFSSNLGYESSYYDRIEGITDKFISYVVPAGTHTIDIKFRKDSSVHTGKDQVKFAIVPSCVNKDMTGKILRASNGKVACITEVNTSEHIITMNSALLASNENIAYAYFTSGAIGEASHLEGYHTDAYGKYSHAEGTETLTIGIASHAEGRQTDARADYSHAEGNETNAWGEGSHAEGYRTYATGAYSHVEGRYNEIDQKGNYAHIVGIGTSPSDRRNGHAVDWKGNGTYAGMMTANGGLTLASGTGYGQDIPSDADEGRVFFMPDNTVDCIVECGQKQTGTNPFITTWYYERYESGLVKMWGKLSSDKLAANWGVEDPVSGACIYGTTLTQNLPVTLSSKMMETATITNDSNFIRLALKKEPVSNPSMAKTNTYSLGAYGTVSGTLAFTINYFVLGTV